MLSYWLEKKQVSEVLEGISFDAIVRLHQRVKDADFSIVRLSEERSVYAGITDDPDIHESYDTLSLEGEQPLDARHPYYKNHWSIRIRYKWVSPFEDHDRVRSIPDWQIDRMIAKRSPRVSVHQKTKELHIDKSVPIERLVKNLREIADSMSEPLHI